MRTFGKLHEASPIMATATERYKERVSGGVSKYTVGELRYPGSKERHENIRNLPIKPDDIALVCYPKSGTHWLYRILSFLTSDGDLDQVQHYPSIPMEASPPRRMLNTTTDLPKTSLELIAEAPSPRVISTHLPFELCPRGVQEGKCKIVLVIRNPKDVAVSHFYFHKQLDTSGKFADFPWGDFVEAFCDPVALPYGSWFGNVKNWLQHRDDPNVLLVRFEDMKKDLVNVVSRVAEFIGRPVTGDRAAAIAQRCEFNNMKKSGEGPKGGGGLSVIMRKGVVGDWKSHFTVAQNELFDEVYRREMANSGLDIQFDL